MKDTLKFYNGIYEKLFRKNYTKDTNRGKPALRKFKEFMDKNNVEVDSVVDVGCAWGRSLDYWKEHGVKAVGVDVSKTALAHCNRKGYKTYLSSATDLSIFEDKKFDLYIASDVYEHLRKDDLSDAINEAKRITKKYLLIRPHPCMDKRGLKDKSKALHLTVWSLEEWENFFREHDLEIIKIEENGETAYKNVFLMKINNDIVKE